MAKDSAVRIEIGRSFHQLGTVQEQPTKRWADWGTARDGTVATEGSRWGRMCWTVLDCFCTAENCWAQSLTVSRTGQPGRRERQESRLCQHLSSRPGWAWDASLGPLTWTSPSRGTAAWLSSPRERSQSPCAAPVSTSDRYYPRAFVLVPWLGGPAG